ncbi:MAG: DUF3568 family protein [Candidatus Omnitrophica bacterium]|nr:DUF3568 family protein [Candidatus Omnitrophota bacterium]
MKRFCIVIFAASLIFTSGCIPLLVGAGVVTGYSLSSDSATGNVRSEYRRLWDKCTRALERMEGEIIEAKESKGIIKANVSENSVTIRIDTINSETQRLKVSARKYLMPKPQFAQKVFLKITEDLK